MLKWPRSLQGRLLLTILSLLVGVWVVSALGTWLTVRHQLDRVLDDHLAQAASLLVVQESLEPENENEDERRDARAPAPQSHAPQVAFQVFHDDRLAARSANAPAAPMLPVGAAFEPGFRSAQIDGQAWRLFATQDGDGDLRVVVGERQHARASIAWTVLLSAMLPALLALPLLAAAAWWSVRRATLPLRSLGSALARRAPQATEPVVIEDAPAEMLPMLAALDGLFARIGELRAAEQRFTADAAHELRTPIAAIRAQAQVALAESDDARRRHALLYTLAGCDRATRLVEQLLTLSRIESGPAPAMVAVELGALTRQALAELAPQALAKSQTLALEVAHPCRVAGHAGLLAVLVRNLVDNAIRYSPPNATVQVTVLAAQGSVLLQVDDSGPGMSETDRLRLGERFFRVLGSGQSGSGLGASIVQRIAAVHGAAVRTQPSAALGGLQVTVEWLLVPELAARHTPSFQPGSPCSLPPRLPAPPATRGSPSPCTGSAPS